MAKEKAGNRHDQIGESKITQHSKPITESSAPDHLSRLPDEILLNIFGFIPPPDPWDSSITTRGTPTPATRDYFSLSLTCRSLNNAATTMLYQKYIHNYDHVSSAKFITTLIAKPALAKLVKEVKEVGSYIGAWHRNHRVARRYRNSYSVESMRSIFTNLEIPRAGAYNALFDDDQDLYHNLESALILLLTPNIERLSLNSTPGLIGTKWPDGPFALREPHAALLPLLCAAQCIGYGKVHAFNNLTKLRLSMSGFPIKTISPVLRLESLRDLVLFDYYNYAFQLDEIPGEWSCPPSSSMVENIRLDDFECGIQSLEDLLKSCRLLKTFALTTPNEDFLPWQWPKFKASLQECHPSLTALEIRDRNLGRQIIFRLGSLQGFACLEYLAVPLELLVDPSNKREDSTLDKMLPSRLQTLVLTKGEENLLPPLIEQGFDRVECDRQVQKLLNACHAGRLSLKNFGIWYNTRFPDWICYDSHIKEFERIDDMHFDFHGIEKSCKTLGVHFDYVIRVHHEIDFRQNTQVEGENILIPTRVKRGREIELEYKRHLYCSYDPLARAQKADTHTEIYEYKLNGIQRPAFFDRDDEVYEVWRWAEEEDMTTVDRVPFYDSEG